VKLVLILLLPALTYLGLQLLIKSGADRVLIAQLLMWSTMLAALWLPTDGEKPPSRCQCGREILWLPRRGYCPGCGQEHTRY
jgi:hypothetical protein